MLCVLRKKALMIFCTATLAALRIARLIHNNFTHPNIDISNSFRKKEFILLNLIKINESSILYVVKKFLFLTRRGDIDHSVFLLQ